MSFNFCDNTFNNQRATSENVGVNNFEMSYNYRLTLTTTFVQINNVMKCAKMFFNMLVMQAFKSFQSLSFNLQSQQFYYMKIKKSFPFNYNLSNNTYLTTVPENSLVTSYNR